MPPALPVDERHDRLFRLSRQRQIRFLADKLARHRFRRPLLWTTSPVHIHALDALEYDGLVYDCDREWDELPLEWESELAALTSTGNISRAITRENLAMYLVRAMQLAPLATSRCFPTG